MKNKKMSYDIFIKDKLENSSQKEQIDLLNEVMKAYIKFKIK